MGTKGPKTKITKEMILDAAFNVMRRDGIDNVNARTVSNYLSCSTQPILYNFSTVEEIKQAIYEKADEYHSKYIMNIQGKYDDPMIEIGMLYVRFAIEEPNMFKLLFQSDHFSHQNVDDLLENEELVPIFNALAGELNIDIEQAKEFFFARFLVVHGMASLLANNSMEYNEDYVVGVLQKNIL